MWETVLSVAGAIGGVTGVVALWQSHHALRETRLAPVRTQQQELLPKVEGVASRMVQFIDFLDTELARFEVTVDDREPFLGLRAVQGLTGLLNELRENPLADPQLNANIARLADEIGGEYGEGLAQEMLRYTPDAGSETVVTGETPAEAEHRILAGRAEPLRRIAERLEIVRPLAESVRGRARELQLTGLTNLSSPTRRRIGAWLEARGNGSRGPLCGPPR